MLGAFCIAAYVGGDDTAEDPSANKGGGAGGKADLQIRGRRVSKDARIAGLGADGDRAGDGKDNGAGHAEPAYNFQAVDTADRGLCPQRDHNDGGDADRNGPPAKSGADQLGKGVGIDRDPVDGGDGKQEGKNG